MDNPLEQPAPDDPIARVHEFARDLAWGAVNEKWTSRFHIEQVGDSPEKWWVDPFNEHTTLDLNLRLKKKWSDGFVESRLLRSFGYLTLDSESPNDNYLYYLLTQKAFLLLNRPAIPPKIFISYRQAESSAFASLIEARLNLAAPEAGVYIDKLLEGGEEWERRIKHEIYSRDIFILVYGKTTHKSSMVPKEVNWAKKSGSRIVPVLHNGYTGKRNFPKKLKGIQWIKVEKESAEAYELAILKLLNTLGYPTLQSPRPSQTED
ncbi:MAG: TIR domain-containing protein [Anaerolineaceae bacterium]|nr:TIR domain-containing protein [Anaerolineaceae bacterium]